MIALPVKQVQLPSRNREGENKCHELLSSVPGGEFGAEGKKGVSVFQTKETLSFSSGDRLSLGDFSQSHFNADDSRV